MKNLICHFPTCYAYSVKEPIGELNLKRALDEDTGVFSSFFHLSSPLGQTCFGATSLISTWLYSTPHSFADKDLCVINIQSLILTNVANAQL